MAIKFPRKQAKSTKRTARPKEAKPTPPPDKKAARYDHVRIGDLDVVLLQTRDSGEIDPQDLVFDVFKSESKRRRRGETWLAFYRSEMPHHAGLSTWIGLSKSVPLPVLDLIQEVLIAANGNVSREMGRALHLNLNPFARLSDDGLEIMVPAALVGDPNARRVIERAGVKVIARGFTTEPSNAAALNELFFGSGD